MRCVHLHQQDTHFVGQLLRSLKTRSQGPRIQRSMAALVIPGYNPAGRRSDYEADVTDTPSTKVPVSVKELIRRINATLPEWKQFKFTRNDPVARQLFGDYYIIDLRTHVPTLGKDVERFARDLGVLKPWETVRW
jgi:hypothetical protein